MTSPSGSEHHPHHHHHHHHHEAQQHFLHLGQAAPTHPYHLERKLKKPMMEKRRRARINDCLQQLKTLLLQAAPHQRTKLEKADILEMTVQYLTRLNAHQKAFESEMMRRNYSEGYSACLKSSLEFLGNQGGGISAGGDNGLPISMAAFLQAGLQERLKTLPSPPPPPPQSQAAPNPISVAIPNPLGPRNALPAKRELPLTPPYTALSLPPPFLPPHQAHLLVQPHSHPHSPASDSLTSPTSPTISPTSLSPDSNKKESVWRPF